ncbi:MAG: alpha-amylase family glycosyl hydrolase [Clostridia bacterium]|nr:alpha-amylase family glycosyl hydrolase [Clostridia bacterium]
MAKYTTTDLRNKIIYSVYLRNYSENATFKGIEKDLDRIKDLGVDILWFLPIHPVGQTNKKGTLGCIYSVQNYREVNPEYGTLEEFKHLIDSIHSKDLKIMIDVVYNFTSYESELHKNHPDWFYRKADGCIGSKIEHCDDVIDLDYSNMDLWEYQIESLKYWANLGVDGFRCDLSQLVPLEFWLKAREEVSKVKDDIIWLADSISPEFIAYLREKEFNATSDCEMYQAFDMTYDYEYDFAFRPYLKGDASLETYIERLRTHEFVYPANYVKLRFIENHDTERARVLFPVKEDLAMWTAFLYFQKGAVLLYAGQEAMDDKTPSLFDKDIVNWSGMEHRFDSYMKVLGQLKKDPIFAKGKYILHKTDKQGVILASYEDGVKKVFGVFNVERKEGVLKVDCNDGIYKNLITGEDIVVADGNLKLGTRPVIFEIR